MKQIVTRGIVLTRTNYQESDRILTILTPDHGKVRVIAKAVRKNKSKLAGGIELFCESEIGFIRGNSDLCTLTNARLIKYYDQIVLDIDRTMLGYELIKLLNKVTEDEPEHEYFELLLDLFEALNDIAINIDLVRLWFYAQLLSQAGHTPNLNSDSSGKSLDSANKFVFEYEQMNFNPSSNGIFSSDDVKFLRIVFGGNNPQTLQKIFNIDIHIPKSLQLIQAILPTHIRT